MMVSPSQPGARVGTGDFQLLIDALEAYCGLRVPRDMRPLIEAHVARRCKAIAVVDAREYCRRLSDFPVSREWESELVDLIDQVTNNLDIDLVD